MPGMLLLPVMRRMSKVQHLMLLLLRLSELQHMSGQVQLCNLLLMPKMLWDVPKLQHLPEVQHFMLLVQFMSILLLMSDM